MNVIVSNEKSNQLSNLDVDVIKNVTGVYEADEIVAMFKSFFFDKMILDITAVKNYKNIENIRKLSIGLGEDKLILFLTDEVCASAKYLSDIISIGVYNFTNNINAIKHLIDKPNSYADVAKIQQINSLSNEISNRVNSSNIRVLGIKNVTEHAGASTLVYMLKKELSDIFGEGGVYAIEVNSRDMQVFKDENIYTTDEVNVEQRIRECSLAKIVLVDLNNCKDESFCDDVLYLIEPSTIKLNNLVRENRHIFEKLNGKKIILNKSLLNNKDVEEFEYEANSNVFYNIPPLDERKKNAILSDFLVKVGVTGDNTASKKEEGSRIFGIFKH